MESGASSNNFDEQIKKFTENQKQNSNIQKKKEKTKKDNGGENSPNYFIYSEDELVDSSNVSVDKEGGE